MNKSRFGKLSIKDLARGFVMMTGTTFFGLCGGGFDAVHVGDVEVAAFHVVPDITR